MDMPEHRLHLIRQRIDALSGAPLALQGVTLIAVSKTQAPEAIEKLLMAGQRVFGENRVQEAADKWPALRARYPEVCLHLIGPLQTNKVKDALALFDAIETVDRPALVDVIAKERVKHPALRCKEFYLQVNTGEEPQKSGVIPKDAEALVRYARAQGLPICGLMCVPPVGDVPAPHFALLRTLGQRLGIQFLSMGMSEDFDIAIRMGATHIRIGSALFGARQ
jgi:pyridoxal phosphate enzyme (YggS family)